MTIIKPNQGATEEFNPESLRIDPTIEINEPPVFCKIGNAPAMTAGNFTLLNGKKKAGKTFVVGTVVASWLSGRKQLNVIHGCLPEDQKIVLYFDTEQSLYHISRSVKKICQLTGDPNPKNLVAYGLRPLTPAERLQFIGEKISTTANLGAVVIDGIRDLLSIGINDEMEATSLTSKFLKWTSAHNIHILLLLHQNKNDQNARGHIGTEVGNKAETIITVTKEPKTGAFVVACEDSRDIGFDEFSFMINDEGLPVAADMPQDEKARSNRPQFIEEDRHFIALNNIFRKEDRYTYRELMDQIIGAFDGAFGESACRTFITYYLKEEWISKFNEGNKKYYKYERSIF